MLAELGYLSLLLATGLALLQGLLPWLGLRLASRPLLGCATPLAILVALLLVAALLLLASDTLVRVLASPHEVATGIMTRILGGLQLLFILIKDRQRAD